MSVFFFIVHPARVHLYKNVIRKLEENNIRTEVFVRDKDVVCDLLNAYDIPYQILSTQHNSVTQLLTQQLKFEVKSAQAILTQNPELTIGGFGTPLFTRLRGCKSIDFFDTDNLSVMNKLQAKVLNRIYTPNCYRLDHGKNHFSYPGFHELAYLHPNNFDPDPEVLNDVGLSSNDPFVIIRLVSWEAVHDLGGEGINNIKSVITRVQNLGYEVFVSMEGESKTEIEASILDIPPHKIHHLLYYSDLFIGDSSTMATESAVLGTPAIYISSNRLGYLDELENDYSLIYNFYGDDNQEKGLQKAESILLDYDDTVYQKRRDKLLNDKIDTSEYIYNEIMEIIG